jgi:hypothetical protein
MLTFARRHINRTQVLGFACTAWGTVSLVLLPQNEPWLSTALGPVGMSVTLLGIVVLGSVLFAVGILRGADAARNEPCQLRRSSGPYGLFSN